MPSLHDLGAHLLILAAVLFIGWVWVEVSTIPAGHARDEDWL